MRGDQIAKIEMAPVLNAVGSDHGAILFTTAQIFSVVYSESKRNHHRVTKAANAGGQLTVQLNSEEQEAVATFRGEDFRHGVSSEEQ